MDLNNCHGQKGVSCSQSPEQHQQDFHKCDTGIKRGRSFPKDVGNTFSQDLIKNNDTANCQECSSTMMLFRSHIYAENESLVNITMIEYSTMDPRNSFLELLLHLFVRKPRTSIHLSIYIYKEESLSVCLFVRYAFGQGTTKCNEILHTIPFRPEEGHRIVFDRKFLLQGVFSLL